eukprot:6480667-Prymnesium_polylepis.1
MFRIAEHVLDLDAHNGSHDARGGFGVFQHRIRLACILWARVEACEHAHGTSLLEDRLEEPRQHRVAVRLVRGAPCKSLEYATKREEGDVDLGVRADGVVRL